ncbi:conserved Plasmodium protein, unknown function [Plasmodium vinckei vinckei]|uniref:Uncharacterized protein n=1 Tax=Plasmodium vinckei vinckei TaxID=54757 RepID=A0A449BP44_PLAVN|nr:conserved Plasmodium protein, unknown function [Plasmodium vinckei vinckei]VEV55221.1 conserved Plasmodium protein, unknown function [Plasmodium vinckei vinckei]
MVGKIENRNLLLRSNSMHTKDNVSTMNSPPILYKKMIEKVDDQNGKKNKKKISKNLSTSFKEYNDNDTQNRRSTKFDNGIDILNVNRKSSEASEKTYYYKENSLNNESEDKINNLKNSKKIDEKNNSSTLDPKNGLLDISTSIFSAITKKLTEMKTNEKKPDIDSENVLRKKTVLKDAENTSSNNNTYETDAYLINDEEQGKMKKQNSVMFNNTDNNCYNSQCEENLIFINNAYNNSGAYNMQNQTGTCINTSEISGIHNGQVDLYNNIAHISTNINNPYNNMQFATHAIIPPVVKPSTHLVVPHQSMQPTFLGSNNNINYDGQNQHIFQAQTETPTYLYTNENPTYLCTNENPTYLYANTNPVVNPGIVHTVEYESNNLKKNINQMNRVVINDTTQFYNVGKKETKIKSLLCNSSEKNNKKNIKNELSAEILIYKNPLSNPPKNIKKGTYNIPINNNVFVRTRSLTPHTYYSKNKKNVSPLKNLNVQRMTSTNVKHKNMYMNPICTHEVTYTYPIQNNTTINKLVENCDNKSDLNKCSTETSSLETINEKIDGQPTNLNQKIKNLQNKVSELTKTNKNLNELSQMYKNECNRMRETLATHAVDKNYISPKKIINYEKENLKLEKENDKLREQIKVLGKAILSTHDIAGVKKILAKQIINLNDENEKYKKEIKELKKKDNINSQVMFNLNKAEVSVDAVDSIFLQTKNVIIEAHQSINVFYLNLRNLIDEFFDKIKFLILEDEYTKKEKLLYVTSLEEIINENLTEINGIVVKVNELRKRMKDVKAHILDTNRTNPLCLCKPARDVLENDINHLEKELHKHSLMIKNLRKKNLFLCINDLNSQFNQVEQVECLNDETNIDREGDITHNVDKKNEVNNASQVGNKKSYNKKNEDDNSGLQEKIKKIEDQLNSLSNHINYNSGDEYENESEEENYPKNRKFLVEKLTKSIKKGATHLSKPHDTSINSKKKKMNYKHFQKKNKEQDDNDFYEEFKEDSKDVDDSSDSPKFEDSETENTSSNKRQWMSDEEVEKSKNKMIELLALLKGKHNDDLVENTENYVKSFGKHKSENEYNMQSIYNNLRAIKNSIKNTDDDTENNILALIESQAAEIKIFGNCIDNLKNTVTS